MRTTNVTTAKHRRHWRRTLHPSSPRDPAKRPTAKEALNHRWLRGDSSERSAGRQIDLSVVQRIQRFAQGSLFRRSVFQMIAEELLARPGAAAALAASAAAQDPEGSSGRGSGRRGRGGGARVGAPDPGALRELFGRLEFDPAAPAVDAAEAAAALAKMGFQLRPAEALQLAAMLDTSNSGRVRRAAFAASQIDFRQLQQDDVEAWAEMARRVFSRLDVDQDGGEGRGGAGRGGVGGGGGRKGGGPGALRCCAGVERGGWRRLGAGACFHLGLATWSGHLRQLRHPS
jgi:hypothetical protein